MNQNNYPEQIINFFERITNQKSMDEAFSNSNLYYAFLSKKDFCTENEIDVLFEVVPKELVDLWLSKESSKTQMAPPKMAASLFFIHSIAEISLMKALNLQEGKVIKEGEWFLLTLEDTAKKGGFSTEGEVKGYFYSPDINIYQNDFPATIIPQIGDKYCYEYKITNSNNTDENLSYILEAFIPQGPTLNIDNKESGDFRDSVGNGFDASESMGFVGIMDVGQANCNLFTDADGDPQVYYDFGLPQAFYFSTAPDELKPANQSYKGPIINNRNNEKSLYVILSHWDFEHWSLAYIKQNDENMSNLKWIVPRQHIGPVAMNFFNSLNQKEVWPELMPYYNGDKFTIIKCIGEDINNSGLAILAPIMFSKNSSYYVLMSGDASFENVPIKASAKRLIAGITAVNHGSDSDSAGIGIPVCAGKYNNSSEYNYIAYSYGIYKDGNNLKHIYGCPKQDAIDNYKKQGWNNEQNTAEVSVNSNEQDRGNFKMGTDTIKYPEVEAYKNSYFYNFTKKSLNDDEKKSNSLIK